MLCSHSLLTVSKFRHELRSTQHSVIQLRCLACGYFQKSRILLGALSSNDYGVLKVIDGANTLPGCLAGLFVLLRPQDFELGFGRIQLAQSHLHFSFRWNKTQETERNSHLSQRFIHYKNKKPPSDQLQDGATVSSQNTAWWARRATSCLCAACLVREAMRFFEASG